MDERLQVIADFVQETGRSPQDWFAYQSLNPSEMDDVTAVRIQMASEYPNLAPDELNMLIQSKYKTDPDLHTEEEIRLSQLQMKIDGEKARRSIEDIRGQYKAPEVVEADDAAPIADESWLQGLAMEVDALTGLEFDLGNGNSRSHTGSTISTRQDSVKSTHDPKTISILISVRMVAGITTRLIRTVLSLTTSTPLCQPLIAKGRATDRKDSSRELRT